MSIKPSTSLYLLMLSPILAGICDSAALPETPFEVSTKVSWNTALRPEINILLWNRTNEAVSFSLSRDPPNENRPPCERRVEPLPEVPHDQWTLRDERHLPESLGTIPPKGWAHRAVILTGPYFRPPCEFRFQIRFVDSKDEYSVRGVVNVPASPRRAPPASDSGPMLTADVMIERDLFERHLLVRLLVRNGGDHAERIWISDRSLVCKKGTRMDWSTEQPVPQGQDIGPAFIDEGGWAVLVSAVKLVEGDSSEECWGTMTISRRALSSWVPWKTIRFELSPTGFLRLPEFVDPAG